MTRFESTMNSVHMKSHHRATEESHNTNTMTYCVFNIVRLSIRLPQIVLLILILLASTSAFARSVAVTPFYGYQFGGSANVRGGEVRFDDTENIGFTVDIPYTSNTTYQFLYIYQDTTLQYQDDFLGVTSDLFDLTIEYYQIGGTREINSGDTTSFVSGGLGVTYFDPRPGQYSDETLFSMSFGMGMIKKLSERFALRVQGRLLLPIQTSGGTMFCNTGCSINLSGGTSIIQADITAGLEFKF